MLRNLKAPGLLLLAALAISVAGPSVAQAENGKAAHFEPGHIDLTNASEGVHFFALSGLPTITCVTVTGTGELPAKSVEFTASKVEYPSCHIVSVGIKFNVIIDVNNCDFLYTAGTWTGAANKSDGSAHIKCPENQSIQITIRKLDGTPKCEFDVAPQTPTSGAVTFINGTTEAKMAVTAHADSLVLHATQTTITAHDPLCKNNEVKTLTYSGSVWFKETNASKEYVDTTVTG